FDMAMTNAERMKKYREKIKKDKAKYEAVKAKARIRNNSIKTKLTEASLVEYRTKSKIRQQKYRENKRKRLINKPPPSSFKSRQSFGKSLKKVNSSLPKCDKKKKVIIQHLAETFGLIPKSKHQRTTIQLADKLKNDVHNFYLRDDISYQLPGKRDTVVIKEDDRSKVTYQKRILFNNLRETYELFKEENDNVYLSRSSFAELRPPFVIPKAALTHRNCLYVTHDKFVVDSALKIILNHIETVLPNVEEINCFSDGAASQFKQRFHFRNLTRIADERKINLSWHFFATSHGKGVVDGIGGIVKRLVWSAILAGGVCRSAEDFIKLAKKKTKKIILIEITRSDIDSSKTKLENLFKTAKSIPETLKMHSVKVVDENELEFRYYSTCSEKKTITY
ncbi:unnamed protein product, partial [Rotaria sp. Silwood1]